MTYAATTIALLAALVLAPRGAQAQDFRWPVPTSATVTESALKDGKRSKLRYRVRVRKDAGKLLVEHDRLKILLLEGLDLKHPAGKALVSKLERQAARAIPGMVVDPASGRFQRIVGVDRMVKRLSTIGLLSPEELQQFKAMMKRPEIIAALEREVSQLWVCWAGVWAGAIPSTSNPVVFRNLTLDVIGQPWPFLVQVNGAPDPKRKGHILVSFEAKLSSVDSRRKLADLKKSLALVTGGRRSGAGLTGVAKTYRCEASLDAKTLRPATVSRYDEVTLYEMRDGKASYSVMKQTHNYTFDWAK